MDALAHGDVWAVGERTSHPADEFTFTEHWDGSSWRRVPSPNLSTGFKGDELAAVSGTSPTDVWAVGHYVAEPEVRPLTEHWDGTRWSTVAAPAESGYDELSGVDAVSADDVWAVGSAEQSHSTLVEHWNGTRWTHVSSPDRGSHWSVLNAVTAISATDVWAVGYYNRGDDARSRMLPLAEHWDGARWSLVRTPHPADEQKDTALTSVGGSSPDDVWAVGDPRTLEHWDGRSWTLVAAPDDGGLALGGVTAISGVDVWAVGMVRRDASADGWHLHWDGTGWTSR